MNKNNIETMQNRKNIFEQSYKIENLHIASTIKNKHPTTNIQHYCNQWQAQKFDFNHFKPMLQKNEVVKILIVG
jgi:hypothetical protein